MINAPRLATALLVGALGSALAGGPQTGGARETPMTGAEITIRETTQPTVSGHLVGVSNIWERDLPDAQGTVATRLSATLSIVDPNSGAARVQKVARGNIVALGGDRYRVVAIEQGTTAPGSVTLAKEP